MFSTFCQDFFKIVAFNVQLVADTKSPNLPYTPNCTILTDVIRHKLETHHDNIISHLSNKIKFSCQFKCKFKNIIGRMCKIFNL